MEVAIVIVLTIIVIAVRGLTSMWLGQLTTRIHELESEEVDTLQRMEAVEATKLQLERDKQALEREQKLLENDRDLVLLDIQKLGVEPIPESEVDAVAPASAAAEPAGQEGKPGSDAEQEAEESGDGATQDSGRPKVLVVDDNDDLRELLQQILSKTYDVAGAADGYEALTKIVKGKQRYDVVVTDLKMPNVNGISLMQSLPKDVPVIVISGFLQREDFQRALEDLSPIAIFEKPFRTAELKRAIHRAAPSAPPEENAVSEDEKAEQDADRVETAADGVEIREVESREST